MAQLCADAVIAVLSGPRPAEPRRTADVVLAWLSRASSSSRAPARRPSAVVPVLAAIEAAGMRVRAIDVGGVGGGGGGVADRMRRALLGEGAERKLRRELEISPPDAAVVFDPHAALALTVARDQVQNPAPVIAVVGDLDPAAGVGANRCRSVPRRRRDRGGRARRCGCRRRSHSRRRCDRRARLRRSRHCRIARRCKHAVQADGQGALVEVGGLGAELTGQLSMQLSLLDTSSSITFLFDAGRRRRSRRGAAPPSPALGLKGKLFGARARMRRCSGAPPT